MPPRRRTCRETLPAPGDGNAPKGLANTLGRIFQQLTAALPGSRTDFGMERARRHGAYSFSFAPEPIDSQNSLNRIERVFTKINCPKDRKVGLAVDYLDGVAFEWWHQTSQEPGNVGPMTWDQFKIHFNRRYFGTAIRDRMKNEFLNIEKGDKILSEFEQRFTQLSHFVLDLVSTEEERISRFIHGLGHDYLLQLTTVSFYTYHEVVNAALRVKTMLLSVVRPLDTGGPSQGPSKRAASTSGSGSSVGSRQSSSSSPGSRFRRGEHGRRSTQGQFGRSQFGQSRASSSSQSGASGSQSAQYGKYQTSGMYLYQRGATLKIEWVFKYCSVMVDGINLEANLIPLDLVEFDVILGMDFLGTHQANIDCFRKVVVFQSPRKQVITFHGERDVLSSCLISALTAGKLLSKGCQAYLAHIVDTNKEMLSINGNIPVVRKFSDVFPDELPGLPL
ncbi:uncharacterized protein LOC133716794 [Rosa rugosa]|uniref:uncharacterized protein LOC133716794 n=1 Tax=Rosa rugosa TaxID=74645 RepID=UPI002B4015CD|nr:uncharacterized protein LOC133716794 [Rosa rugosa]